eukprot:TRINITY_DN1272_c0_g1_i4.p1 TRINITY_DN1272_c0_g1~~TRINITY_DN1272_c0_g1_i4.p1  ORF type:complete len:250 (-),score=39.13 TRINITY_DN1272_c0_g1_i4:328-1077(-)
MLPLLSYSFFFFFLMIRRPPRSTLSSSSAASDVYKRQVSTQSTGEISKRMGNCCKSGNMAPCKRDVNNLRRQLKDLINAELNAISETGKLTALIKGFSGLIDPGHSWKKGSVSNAMTSYMDDMEAVTNDRKRRLEISLREVDRRCNRIRDACCDVEVGQLDMKTFDELRVEVIKDLMLFLSHRDIHMHADALTRLTTTYQHVMDVRISETEETMTLTQTVNVKTSGNSGGSMTAANMGGGSFPQLPLHG